MIPFEEITGLPEFQTAPPEQQKTVLNQYAKDFWSEVYSSQDYISATPDEKNELRSIFDQRFGPELRTSIETKIEGDKNNFLQNMWNLIKSGGESTIAASRIADDVAKGKMDKGTAAILAESIAKEQKKYTPPELEKVQESVKKPAAEWEEADTIPEGAKALWSMVKAIAGQTFTNPKGLAYMTAEQAANMAPGMAGMVSGAKAGGAAGTVVAPGPGTAIGAAAGGVVGGFLGQWGIEAGSEFKGMIAQELAARKLDPTEGNVLSLLADDKFLEKTISKARNKATATSAVSAAMTLAAGKIASGPAAAARNAAIRELGEGASEQAINLAAKQILKSRTLVAKVGTGAAAYGTGIAEEGVSEAAGQYAKEGKVDLGEVALETMGGIGGSMVEVPAAAYAYGKESLGGETPPSTPPSTQAPVVPVEAKTEPAEILEAETLDEAIETFRKSVSPATTPGPTETPVAPVDQAISEFQTNLRTEDRMEGERGVQEELAQVSNELGEFGANRESFIRNQESPTVTEEASILGETPTMFEEKLQEREDVEGGLGVEYVKSEERPARQEGIETALEEKLPDFTASKGKPFKTQESLAMSAKQKGVDLSKYSIIKDGDGFIAIDKGVKEVPAPSQEVGLKSQEPGPLSQQVLPQGKETVTADLPGAETVTGTAQVVPSQTPPRVAEPVEQKASVVSGQEVNVSPSEPMKEAGNYKKGHVKIDGLEISVENPVGSIRTGVSESGENWSTEMKSDYGYIKGTKGIDKDHLDVFIKPGYTGKNNDVFVIDQYNEKGKFDEHKVVLGAEFESEAMKIYNSNYDKGWTGGKAVTRMSPREFNVWSRSEEPLKGPVKAGTFAPKTGQEITQEMPSISAKEQKAAPRDFSGNKIFTQDRVEKARKNIASSINKLSSGLDPELLRDVITVGGAHFERGVRDFVSWSRSMVDEFGEKIQSYLREGYGIVSNHPVFSERMPGNKYLKFEPEYTKTGTIKGAPAHISDKASLDKARKGFHSLLKEGESGRHWYENSAKAFLNAVNGDVAKAEKLIQLVAIYSPQARPEVNTYFAISAWNQFNNGVKREDFKVKTRSQDSKAIAVLYDDETFEGRKTNSFYLNLMSYIIESDPHAITKTKMDAETMAAIHDKVTVDMWMYRVFGFNTESAGTDIGTGKYSFVENETLRMADQLNKGKDKDLWTPYQVQAAVWTAMKARYEDPWVKTKTWEESIKRGFSELNDKGQKTVKGGPDNLREHRKIWHKWAMLLPSRKAIENAKSAAADFSTFVDKATSTVTWESIPSPSLNHDVLNASPVIKRNFSNESRHLIIDEEGNDVLANKLGVPIAFVRAGSGAYAGSISPNSLSHLTPTKSPGEFKRDQARMYARAIQYIFKQDAVPWFRTDPTALLSKDAQDKQKFRLVNPETGRMIPGTKADTLMEVSKIMEGYQGAAEVRGGPFSRGVAMKFSEEITPETEEKLLKGLQVYLGEDAGFTRFSDNEIMIVNFRDDETGIPFMDDEIFLDSIQRFADANSEELAMEELKTIWSEGEYGYVHDWSNDPQGKEIINDGSFAERPDLQAWLRDRRAQFENILNRYSGEQLKLREKEQEFLTGEVVKKTGKPSKTGDYKLQRIAKSGRIALFHWSKKEGLSELDPAMYGTGIKGAEYNRKQADKNNWVDRTYYGVEGGGYKKEPGLGPHKYATSVPAKSLYDIAADPDNLMDSVRVDKQKDPFVNSINLYERKIKEAGYKGYWRKSDMGEVVALFDKTPVTPQSSQVKTMAIRESTGKKVTIWEDGNEALERVENSIEKYYELLGCLEL